MKRADITAALHDLQLPPDSYIVIGSGILAALGIRDTSDIDMVVSPEVYARLEATGWKLVPNYQGKLLLTHGVFEADTSWDDPNEEPNLTDLLATATVIDGVPYCNLERLLAWKQRAARPKDVSDIPLIEAYLASHP